MSIISRAVRLVPGRTPAPPRDIQKSPVDWWPAPGGPAVTTKVDHAVRLGGHVLVCGWSSMPSPLRLAVAGRAMEAEVLPVARPDVARYLGRQDDALGWALLLEDAPDQPLRLECVAQSGATAASFVLQTANGKLSRDARALLAPAIALLRQRRGEDPAILRQLGADDASDASTGGATPFAAGALDDVRATDAGQGIACGWLVLRPDAEAWLEGAGGQRYPLDDAHRVHRADVALAISAELAPFADLAGFMVAIPGASPGERLRLVVRHGEAQSAVAEAECETWPADPVSAARWLFGYPTPLPQLAARVRGIDLPAMESVIQAHQAHWTALPVRDETVGTLPDEPLASIIIPLYGTGNFVEHQLLEFARDPWLRAHAEVIYVIDDRRLLERFAAEAHLLHRLYGVPFRWVWGSTNRGFSGANNLGAAHARAPFLVFLNSDAFPIEPGWVAPLLAPLREDPSWGGVGPRLLFASGGLQHAGMRFERRDDLDVWVNEHPWMGLDPAFDPHQALTEVPAVTGACLAIPRGHFDAVGGWDTGYLIGDFEDSDLCLKLRAAGLRIGYLPTVALTHLERQSFKLLGAGDFRTRVTIFNAVRHESRWCDAIADAALQEATP